MKKVVIIGGGFAGSIIAKKLEKVFDVTLIDSKDYYEYTPGILRTLVEPEHKKKIQIVHSKYLKKVKIIIDCVKKIDKKFVYVKNKCLTYDYLIICSGSYYSPPIKELDLILVTRSNHLIKSHTKLLRSDKILIIGGGLVGVELAAEIITHFPEKKVTIIHGHDKLIERNPDKAIKYAENFLKNRGVTIVYQERIIKSKKGFQISDKGKIFNSDMTFLCTGIHPNSEFMKENFSNKMNNLNQIIVNDNLQVIGCKNIFASGDITNILEEKTAQNAQRQAAVIIKNITLNERKNLLKSYKIKKTPLLISLGKFDGIFIINNFILTGLIPAFLKFIIEKREMWRRR